LEEVDHDTTNDQGEYETWSGCDLLFTGKVEVDAGAKHVDVVDSIFKSVTTVV